MGIVYNSAQRNSKQTKAGRSKEDEAYSGLNANTKDMIVLDPQISEESPLLPDCGGLGLPRIPKPITLPVVLAAATMFDSLSLGAV